jgi:anti-sigma factor RsiW
MTHIPETQLSLYAGGDLEASASIARHLEDCAECRRRVEEFRLAEAWLKSVAAEPDGGQIYTLRESVLKRAARKRSRRPVWWMAAAAATVALVFFAVLLFRPAPVPRTLSRTTTLPPLISSSGSITPLVLPSRDWQGAVRTPRRVAKKPPPRLTLVAKNSEDTPVVRVKTSDPNVVILWVVGDGSEQEKEQ